MMKYKHTVTQQLAAGVALMSLAFILGAAEVPASKPAASPNALVIQKPAWLTEISLGIREAYDDNLLGVSGEGTMDPESSWFTTVSPKLAFNLAPLLGKQKTIQQIAFSYAPDFVTYHNDPVAPNGAHESYNLHRLNTAIKGKSDALSFSLDNAFVYVDGDKNSPVYTAPDNARSGYATGLARERREQFQDRAKVQVQYDWTQFFVRPIGALTFYDLLTYQKALAGYQNYADRYDLNGGVDVGYKVNPQTAFTLGYRYGHQSHEAYNAPIDALRLHSPSDYQRLLFGLEGKPWKWLTVNFQVGPDFRNYSDTAPIDDKDQVTYYGEANIVVDMTSKDSLTFKYKQWQWVVSTGRIPYYDSSFDLTYRRKLTKALVLDLGARLQEADYTIGNVSSSLRDDRLYGLAAALNYTVNANMSLNLAYAADFGRNQQPDLAAPQYREYDRQVVGLSALFKF